MVEWYDRLFFYDDNMDSGIRGEVLADIMFAVRNRMELNEIQC